MGWMFLWGFGAVALVALLVWVLTSARREDHFPESPELVLKRRYANGEIDVSTYEQMLGNLKR